MKHTFKRVHIHASTWHHVWSEGTLSLALVFVLLFVPTTGAMRFQERSLYVEDNEPSAVTSYTIKFRYMSPAPIGSVDMLFCLDPIPYHPCVTPPGFSAANAVLSEQSGETGYSIQTKTTNRIVLTRSPNAISQPSSSYTFDNIRNSSDPTQAFSIRMKSHSSTNATGPQIDFGTVRGQVTKGIVLETQVPPMLIFCAAEQVEENCTGTNDNYYTDMGELSAASTLAAQSQMAVGTNASGGFAITANGIPMSAGTSVIKPLDDPTESRPGSNQFGLNLVENTSPAVGRDPEGEWANAIANGDYATPNKYKYTSGDVVAYSPNVSLMKKFTVSYIVNSSNDLRPGVYSTTITYVASGRF